MPPAAKTHNVIHMDCVAGLRKFFTKTKARLIAGDPPYNIGQDYDACDDKRSHDDYLAWTRDWGQAAFDALTDDGACWVAIGDGFVSEVDVTFKELGFKKRAHICWYFTFGQHNNGNFTRSHTHWLYYSKLKSRYVFNSEDPLIRVPSARQQLYKDKRADPRGRMPDDTWILRPAQIPEAFTPLEDTWHFSRICGTFKAKATGISPNQMRVEMMERIVRLCSDPGDIVVDPFGGTFTTGEAALRCGRRFLGFDVSKKCCDFGRDRLDRVAAELRGEGPGTQQQLFKESA